MELYAPDCKLSFTVRIATQTILSKVVKVVQVNNATDVRIARTVLLPSTTYKAYLSSTDYKKDQQLKKRLDIYGIMPVLGVPIY